MKFVAYTKSYTSHISKTIHAPLRYVYDWCTDYRDTDPKLTGSKTKRKILLRTGHRIIYTETYRSHGKPTIAVDIVTRYPPKGWHLNFVSDEDDEVGDYTLTALGPKTTRLHMTFTDHYKIRHPPTKAEFVKVVKRVWDKYAEALERDYRHTRP